MFTKNLKNIESRVQEIEKLMTLPEVIENRSRYEELTKEYSSLQKIMRAGNEYINICSEITEQESMLNDSSIDDEMHQYISEEIASLHEKKEKCEKTVRMMLIPKEKNEERNTIVEIRAGTGGEEAALFAANLLRMYSKYAESRNWRVEIMSSSPTGLGGFKEVIFSIEGENVYREMQFESGAHRVQRIPTTESGGRIHTSAVTVAVLPEAEDIEVSIDQKDLRIDVCRASGPGGQSVNTTDSAVRIVHIPTGITVRCQDEKSQHKNKAKAMRILKAHILDKLETDAQQKMAADRKSQVGSGDRSERIRTYNFPQSRVTDHRINVTLYDLENILNGALEPFLEALIVDNYQKKLKDSNQNGTDK